MPEEVTPVADVKTESVAEATTQPEGQVPEGTLPTTSPDAEKLRKDFESRQSKLESQLKRFEDDIRKQKSSFQRREAEIRNEFKAREKTLQERVRQAELATLDDNAKEAYKINIANEEMNEMRREFDQLRIEKAQLEGKNQAVRFFTENGVPMNALELDGTMEETVASGYQYMAQELAELRKLKESAGAAPKDEIKSEPPKKPMEAPKVDKGSPGSLGTSKTWDDILKQYSSADKPRSEQYEDIYRKIDQGLLDPSIIPLRKEE